MICVNGSTDTNDSAISYSPPSLSSSPVKPSAIQQLISSPILNSPQIRANTVSADSDSDLEVNEDSTDVLVAATPDISPQNSQTNATEMPTEVASSQATEPQSESSQTSSGRSPFRRQPSVCLNPKITASPRALAILKNAIKTSYNSNKICDKSEVKSDISRSVGDMNVVNGTHSPPNGKSFRSSPLSRGSVFLKAVKERLEKKESERSPKISCNLFQNDSNLDKGLTSILRKRELPSSPTGGDHKAKKKKVLFAEPVVSSSLEFRPSPTPDCFRSFTYAGIDSLDKEVEELTNDKKRNNLVHQNSTFDTEFVDITYDFVHNSPLLFSDDIISDDEPIVLNCGPKAIEETFQSSQVSPEISSEGVASQTSEDMMTPEDDFQCSQVMPKDNDLSESSQESIEGHQSVSVQTGDEEDELRDPIVHIPMRLSIVKQMYTLFGNIIREYSSDYSDS